MSINFELPAFIRRFFERPIQPMIVQVVRVVQLRHLIQSEVGEPDRLVAVLEFDDLVADPHDPQFVDLGQLQASLDENSTFFIWTCSCGSAGCAGMFNGICVTHMNGETEWHDLDGKRKFIFKSPELRDAICRGINEGRAMLIENPTLKPVPEFNEIVYENEELRIT